MRCVCGYLPVHCRSHHKLQYGQELFYPPSVPFVTFACHMRFGWYASSLLDCGVWVGGCVSVLHCCCVIFFSGMSSYSNSGVGINHAWGWGYYCCVGAPLGCCVSYGCVRLSSTPILFLASCVCVVCPVYCSSLEVGIVVLVLLRCCVQHSWIVFEGEVCCVCYVLLSSCHPFVSRSLVLCAHHSLFEVWSVG